MGNSQDQENIMAHDLKNLKEGEYSSIASVLWKSVWSFHKKSGN